MKATHSPVAEQQAAVWHTIGTIHQIAEVIEGERADRGTFEKVRCVDVSHEGFSFYRTTMPKSEQLIIASGDLCDDGCHTVRVIGSQKEERWGQVFYRIDCNFPPTTPTMNGMLALWRRAR